MQVCFRHTNSNGAFAYGTPVRRDLLMFFMQIGRTHKYFMQNCRIYTMLIFRAFSI